jgi:hypothetical protein
MAEIYENLHPGDAEGLEDYIKGYEDLINRMKSMTEDIDIGIIDENDFENGIEGVNNFEREFTNAVQHLVDGGMRIDQAIDQVSSDMGV